MAFRRFQVIPLDVLKVVVNLLWCRLIVINLYIINITIEVF